MDIALSCTSWSTALLLNSCYQASEGEGWRKRERRGGGGGRREGGRERERERERAYSMVHLFFITGSTAQAFLLDQTAFPPN